MQDFPQIFLADLHHKMPDLSQIESYLGKRRPVVISGGDWIDERCFESKRQEFVGSVIERLDELNPIEYVMALGNHENDVRTLINKFQKLKKPGREKVVEVSQTVRDKFRERHKKENGEEIKEVFRKKIRKVLRDVPVDFVFMDSTKPDSYLSLISKFKFYDVIGLSKLGAVLPNYEGEHDLYFTDPSRIYEPVGSQVGSSFLVTHHNHLRLKSKSIPVIEKHFHGHTHNGFHPDDKQYVSVLFHDLSKKRSKRSHWAYDVKTQRFCESDDRQTPGIEFITFSQKGRNPERKIVVGITPGIYGEYMVSDHDSLYFFRHGGSVQTIDLPEIFDEVLESLDKEYKDAFSEGYHVLTSRQPAQQAALA